MIFPVESEIHVEEVRREFRTSCFYGMGDMSGHAVEANIQTLERLQELIRRLTGLVDCYRFLIGMRELLVVNGNMVDEAQIFNVLCAY